MKIFLNKKILVLIAAVIAVTFFQKIALAVWSGSSYAPGQTDNPECLPSQTNCDVTAAVVTETDPIFTAWDKDYADLTNTPTIPTTLSELAEDVTHRVVTDSEKIGWNAKQNALTLTTGGASGAATFIGDTLNIPTYTLAGLGGLGLTSLSATGPLTYNSTTGAFAIGQSSTSTDGYISSTDWNTFNEKESTLTFSTGLIRATNTITNNLSTGITGGQSVIGGTGSGESLTLSSTNDVTKGSLLFGTSSYNESFNTLGIGTTASTTHKVVLVDTVLAGSGAFVGSLLNLSQTWNTTGSPTAIKLNVTNTASGATSNLMDLQVGGTSVFRVSKDGGVATFQVTSNTFIANPFYDFGVSRNIVSVGGNITGSSGAGVYTGITFAPTINQTGTATGITRGLYINPTLTAAADFRAVEVANNSGYGIYQSGAASNYLQGITGIGTTPLANTRLHVQATGNSTSTVIQSWASSTPSTMITFWANGQASFFNSIYIGSATTQSATFGLSSGIPSSATSGSIGSVAAGGHFIPTSGTATYSYFDAGSVINQTGGANGITRGLYIHPTLTSAADFRAIETTSGSLAMADSYLAGSGSLAGSLLNLSQTWNTTGTPTAIKLNVTDTASTGTSLLMDLQVAGVSKMKVDKTGLLTATGSVVSGNNITASGLGFSLAGGFSSLLANYDAAGANANAASGTYNIFGVAKPFVPTSGTAIYNGFVFAPTINQTGGANGITRGLYINPTLTAAADFRAVEVANNSGFGIYQSGASATNYFNGNVGVGTSTPSTKLHVLETGILSSRGITSTQISTGAQSPLIQFQKARGVVGGITTVTVGDYVGALVSSGYDGANYIQGASILFQANDTIATGSVPTDIVFQTGTTGLGTERMRILSTGNLGIGTGSPTAGRLVIADTINAGSGALAGSVLNMTQTWNTTGSPTAIALTVTNTASGASANLINLAVVGVGSAFRVSKAGTFYIGTDGGKYFASQDGSGGADINGKGWLFASAFTSEVGNLTAFRFRNGNGSRTPISGVHDFVSFAEPFAPTSGTASYSVLNVLSTINQTGGANGITRGLYINPTLTAAADFRAIETTNGKVVFADTISAGSGSLAGSVLSMTQTWNTTGSPNAIFLNVTDTASGSLSRLLDLRVGNAQIFNVTKGGSVYLGVSGGSPFISPGDPNAGTGLSGGKALLLGHYLTSDVGYGVWGSRVTATRTPISGENGYFKTVEPFNPTSGTAVYNTFNLAPVINQTGGANGITRGLYINPTLTAAADFRAIQTTSGSLTMADSYLAGSGALAGSLLNLSQMWNTTGNPTAIKLNVTNTVSGATSNLMDLQVDGVSKLFVDKTGNVTSAASFIGNLTTNGVTAYNASLGFTLRFKNLNVAGSGINIDNALNGNILTHTSGNYNILQIKDSTFQPTSGTAIFNSFVIGNTINQTGGANGITRGLYINPTLTAAADFRAVELTNNTGKGIYQSGTAVNSLAGFTGIAQTTPGYALHVGDASLVGIAARFENSTGTCDINPTTSSLACSSDETLKKNITVLDGSTLEKLSMLRPVTYNWNSEFDTDATHIGFIAQEVESIFPNLVSTDPHTGLKSLSYGGLTPYLVKAVQEMNITLLGISDLTTTNTWRDGLVGWFANSANGITEFVSGSVRAKDKLCIGEGSDEVCITKEELLQMKANAGSTTASPTPLNTPSVDPVVDPSTSPLPADPQPVDGSGGAPADPVVPTPDPQTVDTSVVPPVDSSTL